MSKKAKKIQMMDKAFDRGYEAFRDGETESDCPYDMHDAPDAYKAWMDGYSHGEEEYSLL